MRTGRLKFPDDFFGCKLGLGLGLVIIRRHEAGGRLAPDEKSGMRIRGYGRSPMSRSALVGNNRKLRYLGQIASANRTPRFSCCDVNGCKELPVPRPLARAFVRRGRGPRAA